MRDLDTIAADPRPGDMFIRGGLVFEVLAIEPDGCLIYRAQKAKFKRPARMTKLSWASLASDRFSSPFDPSKV